MGRYHTVYRSRPLELSFVEAHLNSGPLPGRPYHPVPVHHRGLRSVFPGCRGTSVRGPAQFQFSSLGLGREQERERFAAYFHRQLAPDLLALAFSIEGVRAELEAQDHPSAPKLQEILNRLTEMIEPMRQEILKETALPDQN